jgi:hypothetical protein
MIFRSLTIRARKLLKIEKVERRKFGATREYIIIEEREREKTRIKCHEWRNAGLPLP